MPVQPPSVRLVWPGRAGNGPGEPSESPSGDLAASLDRVREGDGRITLVRGDNLPALEALRERGVRAALVYLDPPFFTGREHTLVERRRGPAGVVRTLHKAFDDRWESLDAYLAALAPRVAAARELLVPEGCLVLHVDPKTSHYSKVLCDEVFGPECFASEIVWRYRRWPSKTKNFQRVHDVLLRYVRDPKAEPRFHQLYEPLAPSTLATWGDRKQRAVTDRTGRRLRSSTTADPTPGTPLGDVWDIGIVAPVAKERNGYPTQKPEALLERLVTACTAPGDLVVDPYVGSGTTLAVCARTGRHGIGIDIGRRALLLTRRRLRTLGVDPAEERVIPLDGPASEGLRAPARRDVG